MAGQGHAPRRRRPRAGRRDRLGALISRQKKSLVVLWVNLPDVARERIRYPRTVREWKRGSLLADAPVVFEGAASDVSVGAYVSRSRGTALEWSIHPEPPPTLPLEFWNFGSKPTSREEAQRKGLTPSYIRRTVCASPEHWAPIRNGRDAWNSRERTGGTGPRRSTRRSASCARTLLRATACGTSWICWGCRTTRRSLTSARRCSSSFAPRGRSARRQGRLFIPFFFFLHRVGVDGCTRLSRVRIERVVKKPV